MRSFFIITILALSLCSCSKEEANSDEFEVAVDSTWIPIPEGTYINHQISYTKLKDSISSVLNLLEKGLSLYKFDFYESFKLSDLARQRKVDAQMHQKDFLGERKLIIEMINGYKEGSIEDIWTSEKGNVKLTPERVRAIKESDKYITYRLDPILKVIVTLHSKRKFGGASSIQKHQFFFPSDGQIFFYSFMN